MSSRVCVHFGQILHAALSQLLRHTVETQTFFWSGSNFINELRNRTPLEVLTSTGNGISRSSGHNLPVTGSS
jgi:hypothetical protein